ncbi:PIR Superfamily Protein [Plasmodium ovale curtisi]|uniref:PIR Superfamily Protein n=1 Tax=Plasmodium ovale curtisi TaxID=864141 RepID=A0A1A8WL44_PLAOA|nr:PIR Superfamily Protein [Plasmodium ovale curtisi]
MAGGKTLNNGNYYQIFYKIRDIFNNNPDNQYDDFLHKTDQTLRNIGMYLIENYKGDYSYCTPDKDCTERCSYLNAWLNEKKSIYTSNGKCAFYNKLWQDHIEELWNKLDGNANQGKKCTRDGDLSNKEFPKDKFSLFCNMNPSEVLSYTCPDKAYANSCTTMLTSSNLGNKIKNIIKNKIGIGNSTDEENNDELLSSQNDTMLSINRMYNINYNSPRN